MAKKEAAMATETTVVKGINAKQLEAFNKQYAASPANFTLGLQAKTTWEGRGLGNLGKVGRWTLGGQPVEKPTRDSRSSSVHGKRSVTLLEWRERMTGLSRSKRRFWLSVPA